MQELTNEINDDPQCLAKNLVSREASVIAIDGCDDVGKSYLANQLKKLLGGTVLDVDDYIESHNGHYLDALKLDDLRSAAVDAERPLFIPGICLREVFRRANVNADLFVYVRKWVSHVRPPHWHKKNVLDCEQGDCKGFGDLREGDIDLELGPYHRDIFDHSHPQISYSLIMSKAEGHWGNISKLRYCFNRPQLPLLAIRRTIAQVAKVSALKGKAA